VPKRGSSKTPWELFYDVKPSITSLRVFGCLAMVHLPPRLHQSKTDAVSEECTFVGYVPDSNASRFLSWRTGQFDTIESVHVVWQEDQSPTLPQSTLASDRIDSDDDDDDFQEGLVQFPPTPAMADTADVTDPDPATQPEDTGSDGVAESTLGAELSADWLLHSPTINDDEDTEQPDMVGGR
jgi:hypothetical protein